MYVCVIRLQNSNLIINCSYRADGDMNRLNLIIEHEMIKDTLTHPEQGGHLEPVDTNIKM